MGGREVPFQRASHNEDVPRAAVMQHPVRCTGNHLEVLTQHSQGELTSSMWCPQIVHSILIAAWKQNITGASGATGLAGCSKHHTEMKSSDWRTAGRLLLCCVAMATRTMRCELYRYGAFPAVTATAHPTDCTRGQNFCSPSPETRRLEKVQREWAA